MRKGLTALFKLVANPTRYNGIMARHLLRTAAITNGDASETAHGHLTYDLLLQGQFMNASVICAPRFTMADATYS